MATLFGVGALVKAQKCVTAATKSAKYTLKASTVAMTLDGGIGAVRLGQGIYPVGWKGGDGAVGYFGDAFLRLAGLSVQAIKRLRGPHCFVAGTAIHAENGVVGIEAVRAGERVWGFDRQAGAWALGTVTATKRTESVTLTTATLTNGESITGTDGHPVWVVEGDDLDARGRPDDGANEATGATPGRWVPLAGLRDGDVVLTRGKPVRVAGVRVRADVVSVYSIVVSGLHSYAVGACGVLAHNGCADEANKAGDGAKKVAKTTETPPPKAAEPAAPAKPAATPDAPSAPAAVGAKELARIETRVAAEAVLKPGGVKIGIPMPPNNKDNIRLVTTAIGEAETEAKGLFNKLVAETGATPIDRGGGIIEAVLPNAAGAIKFRPASASSKALPTVDVNIKDIGIREVVFKG